MVTELPQGLVQVGKTPIALWPGLHKLLHDLNSHSECLYDIDRKWNAWRILKPLIEADLLPFLCSIRSLHEPNAHSRGAFAILCTSGVRGASQKRSIKASFLERQKSKAGKDLDIDSFHNVATCGDEV